MSMHVPLLTTIAAVSSLLAPASAQQVDTTKVPWDSGPVLWHRHFDDAMYSSVGLSKNAGLVFAGTYLNPPRQAEAVPLFGDGVEEWARAGTQYLVDASRNGQVLAAIDHDSAASSATIMEFRPGSPVPLWTYDVSPCRTLVWQGWSSRKPIQVSENGSIIAVTTNMDIGTGHRGRLYVFQSGNGTPIVEYDLPAPAGNATATALSADGAFVAIVAWPSVYVYDVVGQTLRWSGPLPAGNDALAISGDGTYLAWGWSTFYLRHWTGTTYDPLWTHTPGSGIYVGQCALTNDGSTLAVTWDNGNTTPNEASLDLYEIPALNRLWTYTFANAPLRSPSGAGAAGDGVSRAHVDIASQMCFSRNGEKLAVAGWGGQFPEIHVFDRSVPAPMLTLDTPGSMFDIDVFTTPMGMTYAVACGKAVHAGQSGRGGDLYAVLIPRDVWGVHWSSFAPLRAAGDDSGSAPENHRTRTVEGVSAESGR